MAENRGFDGVFSQLSEDAEGEPAPIATTKSFWKRRVFDVTPVTILIYVLVTIVIAVSVGLIVHFAHPCDSCSCPSFPAAPSPTAEIDDDDFWKRCVEMSLERDECKYQRLCAKHNIWPTRWAVGDLNRLWQCHG